MPVTVCVFNLGSAERWKILLLGMGILGKMGISYEDGGVDMHFRFKKLAFQGF